MEEELKQLKTVLRSLVVSSPSQVDVRSLMRDYRDMVGQQIPLSKFGCKDPVSFLKKYCADCFLFQGAESNPILTLIVPETLKHIDQFVQRQKPSQSAKIKGKRRSVNEAVLKQNTSPENLITATYQLQKNIGKEIPTTHYNTTGRSRLHKAVPETVQSGTKESNCENKITYESQSTLSSKYKSQASNRSLEYKSDSQRREYSPKNNTSVKIIHEDREGRNYRTAKTSTSNKENDAVNEQSEGHSSAYLNFLKKRMPFVNVNQTEKSDYLVNEDSYSSRPLSSSTSSSKRAQLEELQRELSEMILQEPQGILCTDLLRKYRQRYGRELEFSRFGFTSVLSVAVTLPGCAAHALADDWLLTDERAPPPRPPRAPLARPRPSTPTDPEDALPFIDFEADVFPPDCMHYMDSIPAAALGDTDAGHMLEVMVGEVYSPSHFWLIRLGPQHNIAMEELMDEMNEYFKSGAGRERRLALGAVRAGHYCSSCYLGDWHRSLIVKVLDSDTVKVRHVDYGTVEAVRAAELRPLLRAWAALPVQAVRARLAAAAPPAAARRWPRAAAARFLAAVTDRRLVANVVARDYQEDILEVVLIDTSTAEDVSIGELLVRAGHADAHARPATGSDAAYLFPQFAALEAGDTPNYAEIQAYLRDGIALDYVEDYRRHVPAAAPPRPPPTALVSPRPAVLTPPASPPAPAAPPPLLSAPPDPAPPPDSASSTAPSSASSSAPSPAALPTPTAPPKQEPEPVTLSAADCEVFALLSRMDPAVAQRFMMEAIQRSRQHSSAAPLNPLAPEFPAPSDSPAPAHRSKKPALPDTTFSTATTTTIAPATPAPPVTPAPQATPDPPPAPAVAVDRSLSVRVLDGQQKLNPGTWEGRSSAPPAPGVHPAPAPPRPAPYSMPLYGTPLAYPPAPPFPVAPVAFGPGPPYAPGWVPPASYGPLVQPQPPAGYGPPAPPHTPFVSAPYAHVRPPPGFERFY